MSIPTKERLAQVLHAEGLFELERNARAGLYDDYESNLPGPITALVQHLNEAGRHALAQRAAMGEFDGTKEEGRAWMDKAKGSRGMEGL